MKSFSQFQRNAQVLICSLMTLGFCQPTTVVEASTALFACGCLFFLQVQRQMETGLPLLADYFPFHSCTAFHLHAIMLFMSSIINKFCETLSVQLLLIQDTTKNVFRKEKANNYSCDWTTTFKNKVIQKGGFSKLLGLFSFTYSDQRNAQF